MIHHLVKVEEAHQVGDKKLSGTLSFLLLLDTHIFLPDQAHLSCDLENFAFLLATLVHGRARGQIQVSAI